MVSGLQANIVWNYFVADALHIKPDVLADDL